MNFARSLAVVSALAASWLAAVAPVSVAPVAVAADINALEPPAPNHPNAGLDEALRILKAGDPKRALDKLTQVKADHPDFPEPRTVLAQLYLALNQLGPARQELERSVAESPLAPEPYLLFGELALHDQRLTEAECLFDRGWVTGQAFSENAERKKSASIRSQAGLAAVAEQRGQWQEARDHLKAWEELDPKNGVMHQRLGRALFQLKQYKEALAELRRGAEEEKKLLPAEIVMGQLYQAAGDHKIAGQYIAQAIKNSPDDLPTRMAAAEWALRTNELTKAKAEVEVIAKLDPDGLGTNLLRGSIARVEHKLPEAESYFQAARLKSPGNFAAANSLALVLVEEPEDAKRQAALEYATLNAEKYAQNPEAWSTLAWVYFQLQRFTEAEQAMERALSARTLNPDSAFFLGTMLERRGKLKEARAVLEKSLETPEAFAYRKEVTALLAKLKQETEAQDRADPLQDDADKSSAAQSSTDKVPASQKNSSQPASPKGLDKPAAKPSVKAKP